MIMLLNKFLLIYIKVASYNIYNKEIFNYYIYIIEIFNLSGDVL